MIGSFERVIAVRVVIHLDEAKEWDKMQDDKTDKSANISNFIGHNDVTGLTLLQQLLNVLSVVS